MPYNGLTYLTRTKYPKSTTSTFESKAYSEPSHISKELTAVNYFYKKLHFKCLMGSECDL